MVVEHPERNIDVRNIIQRSFFIIFKVIFGRSYLYGFNDIPVWTSNRHCEWALLRGSIAPLSSRGLTTG
ncbi:hypothetical protein [Rickettsia monacensis]|uniref:hypothetical protein n=1 Tax=Rickettsia monacensis TaxID=109232 RepID=UPI00155AFF74|nr:hypothetical protein [Rickettsia monacensis]